MRIALIVEGDTETAFLPSLRSFLQQRLPGRMPKLVMLNERRRVPKGEKLKRMVETLLYRGEPAADYVIALTDVYTGTSDFKDAKDAKKQMRQWVGDEPRFYPHAAQYEFEAWILPFWSEIQRLAGHNQTAPGSEPERVNHANPPSKRIQEIFRRGSRGSGYVKPRDAARILRGKDLMVSVQACPELKAFINTILTLCQADRIE